MDKCCARSGITNDRRSDHHVAGDTINNAILHSRLIWTIEWKRNSDLTANGGLPNGS
jgi:hypothetical protein